MNDSQLNRLCLFFIIMITTLAALGEYFKSASILFNVILAIIGILAGYLTNHYFSEKAERYNLGKIASSGNKLSLEIYDSLREVETQIEFMKSGLENEGTVSRREVVLMLDSIAGRLHVLQRMSISANNQWRDVLPVEESIEIQKRLIDLSDEKALRLVTETRPISISQNQPK